MIHRCDRRCEIRDVDIAAEGLGNHVNISGIVRSIAQRPEFVDRYELEIDASQVTFEKKQLLTILVAHLFVKRFAQGEQAYTTREVADELEIPIRIVRQVIYELIEIGVISEIKTEDPKIVSYQPARSIEVLSIKYIIDKLNSQGVDEIPEGNSPIVKEIKHSLEEFKGLIGKSTANKLLKDL